MRYDLCIVGVGPSGLVAGIRALEGGLKVVMIERSSTIDPSPARYDASPISGIEKIVEKMRIPRSGLSFKSFWFSPGHHRFEYPTSVPDAIFLRGRTEGSFCQVLADRFLDAGGELRLSTPMKGVEIEGGKAVSINNKIFFDMLVCASGSDRSILADHCGRPRNVKKIIGTGTMVNNPGVEDECKIIIDPYCSPNGYFFKISCDGRTSAYNVIVDGGTEQHYAKTKKLIRRELGIEGDLFSGHSFIAEDSIECRLRNVLLTGDAGFFNDYGFGYGMQSAILSGYTASDSIIDDYDYYKAMKKKRSEVLTGILARRGLERFDSDDWDRAIQFLERFNASTNFLEEPTLVNSMRYFIKGKMTKYEMVGLCRLGRKLL